MQGRPVNLLHLMVGFAAGVLLTAIVWILWDTRSTRQPPLLDPRPYPDETQHGTAVAAAEFLDGAVPAAWRRAAIPGVGMEDPQDPLPIYGDCTEPGQAHTAVATTEPGVVRCLRCEHPLVSA